MLLCGSALVTLRTRRCRGQLLQQFPSQNWSSRLAAALLVCTYHPPPAAARRRPSPRAAPTHSRGESRRQRRSPQPARRIRKRLLPPPRVPPPHFDAPRATPLLGSAARTFSAWMLRSSTSRAGALSTSVPWFGRARGPRRPRSPPWLLAVPHADPSYAYSEPQGVPDSAPSSRPRATWFGRTRSPRILASLLAAVRRKPAPSRQNQPFVTLRPNHCPWHVARAWR